MKVSAPVSPPRPHAEGDDDWRGDFVEPVKASANNSMSRTAGSGLRFRFHSWPPCRRPCRLSRRSARSADSLLRSCVPCLQVHRDSCRSICTHTAFRSRAAASSSGRSSYSSAEQFDRANAGYRLRLASLVSIGVPPSLTRSVQV